MGSFLLPFSYSFYNFWNWKSEEEGAAGWDDGEKTRKQREQVDVRDFISFTALGLRNMQPFSMK